jgi:putative transcriptional regulator
MQSINLTNHFLIAMPSMTDPYFAKSLAYICEHNEQGALGLIINRPIDMTLRSLLEQISVPVNQTSSYFSSAIHFGGPVQMDRGFVLHEPLGGWQATLVVNEQIGLTTSKDILEALGAGTGPEKILITLGYSGWAPGQLEHEVAQNSWLTVAASPQVIFELPAERRLNAAMELLGIDFANLSEEAGHA